MCWQFFHYSRHNHVGFFEVVRGAVRDQEIVTVAIFWLSGSQAESIVEPVLGIQYKRNNASMSEGYTS